MSAHDPLCLLYPSDLPTNSMCSCGLIARVRADERERIAAEIEAKSAEGLERNWAPAAIRAFDIAARIARGTQ